MYRAYIGFPVRGQSFPGWFGIGGFLYHNFGASSGIGGIICSRSSGISGILCSKIDGIYSLTLPQGLVEFNAQRPQGSVGFCTQGLVRFQALALVKSGSVCFFLTFFTLPYGLNQLVNHLIDS